jgi:4-hydroxy-tetrahydrodipicolinate synthase
MDMSKKTFDLNSYYLWTAVVTPMHTDAMIDYESLEKVLKMQEAANNGIVVLGSTGEALNLSKRECKKVLEFTMGLNLKVPVMTGLGGSNLEETIEYLNYLETLPLDAYLMVTPLYAKPGEHGQTHWFKSLMDKATKPCMLYNVPGRTAVKMNFDAVANLSTHKNFWAIKEASGSVSDFKNYGKKNPTAKMYSGDDGMIFDYSPFNLAGLVSVAGNIWPSETNLYVKKSLEKKLTSDDVALWKKACDTLFISSNPVPVKNILWATGYIKNKTMRAPLSDRDLKDNSPLLKAHEEIKNWFSKNK